jgi:phage terminase large subunit GpA-like protein
MGANHGEWLIEQNEDLTHTIEHLTPSEFAEAERYLPASVTRYPGQYRFRINPFMREIVDCFDVRSPVREVNLMKGVQITYTTIAECVLFYSAAHLKTYPCQWLANDDGNARKRLDNNIVPMFVQSGWDHILQSNDPTNARKQGVTKDKMTWIGGGYCLVHGVQTGGKLRQDSIMIQIKDELDAWPALVGNDGDPDKVSDARCNAFYKVRKQFRGSTPLLHGTSKIFRQFKRGDQRHYHVNCIKCGHSQYLRWSGIDKKTKRKFGMYWETDEDGMLIEKSVEYRCEACGHGHKEYDKKKLFDPAYGAKWVPMAKPVMEGIRSYKLPGLYSPASMYPWSAAVESWLAAWDVENNRPKDVGLLQEFYNNVLGEPFEVIGEKVNMSMASKHSRRIYDRGEIPNRWLEEYAGSVAGIVICTVDVQGDWLAVATHAFTRGNRPTLLDYIELPGSTEYYDAGPWLDLQAFIEEKVYIADDGKQYPIGITFIDTSYRATTAYEFCAQYDTGVIAIQGKDSLAKGAKLDEFQPYTTKMGTRGFTIKVDLYKDRMSMVLRRQWDGQNELPPGMLSLPFDMLPKEIRHYTVEYKRQKRHERTGQPMGWEWHRPGNARQELWDLLIYAVSGLEILAWDMFIGQMEREYVDWPEFWDIVLRDKLYYTEPKTPTTA